jgi:hypothetical protein
MRLLLVVTSALLAYDEPSWPDGHFVTPVEERPQLVMTAPCSPRGGTAHLPDWHVAVARFDRLPDLRDALTAFRREVAPLAASRPLTSLRRHARAALRRLMA